MLRINCGLKVLHTSPDDLLRGPGSGGELPSEAAPQLRPGVAGDQYLRPGSGDERPADAAPPMPPRSCGQRPWLVFS
jgi:hypothetical protein